MSMKGTIGYKILTKDPEAIGKMVDALRAKKGMNYQQCFEFINSYFVKAGLEPLEQGEYDEILYESERFST